MQQEQDDLLGQDSEESSEGPAAPKSESELDRLRRQNSELLREVKEERKARRQGEIESLRQAHPWVAPEDLEGVPTAKLRAILDKAPKGEAQPPKPEVPETERAEIERMTKSGASGVPGQAKLSIEDARKLSWPERRKAIADGLVEGVAAPE